MTCWRSGIALTAMIVQLMVAGCGLMLGGELRVDPASPHPSIDLLPAQTPRKLELDPSIMEAFVVSKTDAVNEVPVSAWRSTLMRGFTSGFTGGSSNRSLRLGPKTDPLEVDLNYNPTKRKSNEVMIT